MITHPDTTAAFVTACHQAGLDKADVAQIAAGLGQYADAAPKVAGWFVDGQLERDGAGQLTSAPMAYAVSHSGRLLRYVARGSGLMTRETIPVRRVNRTVFEHYVVDDPNNGGSRHVVVLILELGTAEAFTQLEHPRLEDGTPDTSRWTGTQRDHLWMIQTTPDRATQLQTLADAIAALS